MFELVFSIIGFLIGFFFTSAALGWWWIFKFFPCLFMAGVGAEIGAAVGRSLDRKEKEAEWRQEAEWRAEEIRRQAEENRKRWFQDAFEKQRNAQNRQSRSNRNSRRQQRGANSSSNHAATTVDDLNAAYRILEISPAADEATIKKAWHEKCRSFHPDVLRAKGLADDLIRLAQQEIQKINHAYEMIKKARHIV